MHSYYSNIETRTVKEEIRDKVLNHILKHTSQHEELKYAGFPGNNFIFEKLLRESTKAETHLIGFEKDRSIYNEIVETDFKHYYHCADFSYAEHENTIIIPGDVNQWMSMDLKKFGPTSDVWSTGYKEFLLKFGCWDGVWLDYYSNAHDKLGSALNRLHLHCSHTRNVPVVISMHRGREQYFENASLSTLLNTISDGGTLDRQAWLEYHLSGGDNNKIKFTTTDYIEYKDTSPMCIIFGLIERNNI